MGGSALNKGCIKNLVAVASSNLDVALGDLITRQMALRTPPGGGSRLSQPGRSGPHTQVPPRPPCIRGSLSRKAELRSGSAIAAMMAANVSCGRVSKVFWAILELKRQGRSDSGVS
jgi:hypothetical protein